MNKKEVMIMIGIVYVLYLLILITYIATSASPTGKNVALVSGSIVTAFLVAVFGLKKVR